MQTAGTALVVLLLASTVATAREWRHRDRGRSTGSHLSNRGIVGGRSIGSDYRPYSYRPYGYSARGYRAPRERIIIIERGVVPRGRWRR